MNGTRKPRGGRKPADDGTASGSTAEADRLREKVPPHDADAERSAIASVLLLNEAFDEITDIVETRMFYLERHRKIWAAVVDLLLASKAVDAVLLAGELEQRGELEECGGRAYIAEVIETVPHAGHAVFYAEQVQEHYIARSLADACSETMRDVYRVSEAGQRGTMRELLDEAESRVFSIIERNAPRGESLPIAQALEQAFHKWVDRASKQSDHPGLPTGLNDLDKLVGGFEAQQLIVLGARPGMGKSSAMGGWAVHVAKGYGAVPFFTLEMSSLELAERIVCAEARVDHRKFRRCELEGDDQARLFAARETLQGLPLYVMDAPGQTVQSMLSICRRISRKHPLACVMIDYLQLIEGPKSGTFNYSREQVVANISRRLKFMAKELNVPVIVGAQLNREAEARGAAGSAPRMADLRESGAIEQDADIILFLHRPEEYNHEDRKGEADFVVAKNRSGGKGTVPVSFIKWQMRFADLYAGGPAPMVQQQSGDF